MSTEFEHLKNAELLQLWSRVMAELREREVVRSSNNPVGDYCELLVAVHYGVALVSGSNRVYDLVRDEEVRVQVKGRRITAQSPNIRHWSAMRGLEEHAFDEVAAIALNEDYSLLGPGPSPGRPPNALDDGTGDFRPMCCHTTKPSYKTRV